MTPIYIIIILIVFAILGWVGDIFMYARIFKSNRLRRLNN